MPFDRAIHFAPKRARIGGFTPIKIEVLQFRLLDVPSTVRFFSKQKSYRIQE
jgi:hypothetical protein